MFFRNAILAAAIPLTLTSQSFAASEHIIKWKERDNRIIHSSVCFNYKYGSVDYRNCKSNAKEHFKEKCREFSEKFEKTKHPERLQYKPQRTKFCYSARNYRII